MNKIFKRFLGVLILLGSLLLMSYIFGFCMVQTAKHLLDPMCKTFIC